MDALLPPFLLKFGFDLIKTRLQRSEEKSKEQAEQKAAKEVTEDVMLFWIKEELSYNLDILQAWGGSHDDFALNPAQVRRLCGHLHTQICSLVLSDRATSAILRTSLRPDKIKFEADSEGESKSEPKHHDGLDALLFIVRKVAVLQRIAEASDGMEGSIPQSFNFKVRLKNIKRAHLELYNYLNGRVKP